MATQAKPGDIVAHFPAAGIDLTDAFSRQPSREVLKGLYSRSTILAKNVLGYETVGDRLRGGSRPGLSPLATQVQDYLIQQIDQIITDDDDVQSSQSGRVVHRIAIALGNLYSIQPGGTSWTVATNNASASPPVNESGIMQSSACVQKLFFADGVNWTYWDPDTNAMEDWEAQEGTLPIDSDNNKPRLICTWRGRILLSGLLLDGQAIFAAAVDDPFDWDYGRVPFGADMAWAFSSGEQGLVGDKVTGLIPYTDDLLIIGCNNSILVQQGDVTYGGKRSFITDKVGMAWGKAWCRDPQGNIFFMSNDMKVYVMGPSSRPQEVSQPVKQLLQNIDTGEMNIVAGYDNRTQAIHFFITPLAEPGPSRHMTLELRTMAWSELEFGNRQHDPLCCAEFEGNEPDDRGLFFGSWDGFVRRFDHEAEDDDGTPIESEVAIGPFLTPTLDEVHIPEIQGVMADDSGDVDYEVLTGDTAQEAIESETAAAAGVFYAGRNYTDPVRVAAKAMYVKLMSTEKWAMESIRIVVGTQGGIRQRGK